MQTNSWVRNKLFILWLNNYIGNYTANLAKSWMNVRAKFDGGKQQIGANGGHGKADVRELVYDTILVLTGELLYGNK